MDLSLILLSGLLGAGYYLKNNTIVPQKTVRDKINDNEKPSMNNIYNSTHYLKTRDEEQKMMDESWRKSHNTVNTNIVPRYYNQLYYNSKEILKQGDLPQSEEVDRTIYRKETQKMYDAAVDTVNTASPWVNAQNIGSELLIEKGKPTDEQLSGGWFGLSTPYQNLPDPNIVRGLIPPALNSTVGSDSFAVSGAVGVPGIPGTVGEIPGDNESGMISEMFTDADYKKYGLITPGSNPKDQSKSNWSPSVNMKCDRNGNGSDKMESFNPTIGGPQVNYEAPQHNNMTPFIGGKATQYTDPFAHRQMMESFTGNGDSATQFRYVHKKELEQNDLFSPTYGLSHPYGTPNLGGYGNDRYIPSRTKQNLSSTNTIRVGRGLNKTYSSEPSGGFHDPYRPPQKNVDDLRALGRHKETYRERWNHGKQGEVRGTIGKTYKHLPDTFYINSPDRYNTTVTEGHTKPRARNNYLVDFGNTNRQETSVTYSGGPNATQGKEETYVVPEFRHPHNQNFLQVSPSNVDSEGQAGVWYDYGRSGVFDITGGLESNGSPEDKDPVGYWARGQERDTTEESRGNQRIGLGTDRTSQFIIRPYDNAKATNSQTLAQWKRFGGVGTDRTSQFIIRPYDNAKATNAQTLAQWKRFGGVGTDRTTQFIIRPYDNAKATNAQTLAHWKRPGVAGTDRTMQFIIRPYDNAKATNAQTLAHWKRPGAAGTDRTMQFIIRPYDNARSTTKQSTTIRYQNYVGGSSANEGHRAQMEYDDMYNAEIDDQKELTLQGRAPTFEGVKTTNGSCNVNMSIKMKDYVNVSDRNNSNAGGDKQWQPIKDTNQFGEQAINVNKLPEENIRQPEDYLVQQFKENPFTQPLSSVAPY